jgi:hypothetical protein
MTRANDSRGMRRLFWLLGIVNVAHGLWMLWAPEAWYHHLPAGVPDTGPLNVHFVRDIGAAFTTIGVALCVAAPRPGARRGVLLGVTLFFVLHALVHVADLATGRLHADHWLVDLPGVFLPAVLLLVLCLPRWWRREDKLKSRA